MDQRSDSDTSAQAAGGERSAALNQQPANQPEGPNRPETINSPQPADLDYEMIPDEEVGHEHRRKDR